MSPRQLIEDLRVFKHNNGLTDAHLAQEIGVSHASVNFWMNGRYKPSRRFQKKIEHYLKANTPAFERRKIEVQPETKEKITITFQSGSTITVFADKEKFSQKLLSCL